MKLRTLLAVFVIFGMLMAPSSSLAATPSPLTCNETVNTPGPCCHQLETGWAAGIRYVPRGNWATYTPYNGVAETVILYAGQTMEAGTVTFSDPSNGMVTITINLGNRWFFNIHTGDGGYAESVHIQPYQNPPPPENHAPGQFEYKFYVFGKTFTTTVEQANFYGVHTALGHIVPCSAVLSSTGN